LLADRIKGDMTGLDYYRNVINRSCDPVFPHPEYT